MSKKKIKKLILCLKIASACNKQNIRWGIDSPFQKKINKLVKEN